MIDFQRLFHIGLVVENLEDAMATLGQAFHVSWATPYRFEDIPVWTPTDGLNQIELFVTYSKEGPQHVELIEGRAEGIYKTLPLPGVHHSGIWVEDMAAEITNLKAHGWAVVTAGDSPENGYGTFAYLANPQGAMLLELVSTTLMPTFENWWAGGSFY